MIGRSELWYRFQFQYDFIIYNNVWYEVSDVPTFIIYAQMFLALIGYTPLVEFYA